jgi:hypothetical protein
MQFRLKAFSLHLLASAIALSAILGSLYLGWYRWPGWYLADVTRVVFVMVCVDVVLGPTLTLIIANKNKPRRELVRDIGIIVAVQLCALLYGSVSLWNGRPLYYAFSQNALSLVQAYDIDAEQADLGRQQNPELAPHWYSLPRWVFVPLPEDAKERQRIASGGDDVISMPQYYKPWDLGLASLKGQLRKARELRFFTGPENRKLKQQMDAGGLSSDGSNSIPFTGRSRPLLAVFDPATLKIVATLKAN